ncbi:MAG: PEP-CTERM sorting domain-containing protein [Candidatus Solibacter sp.]
MSRIRKYCIALTVMGALGFSARLANAAVLYSSDVSIFGSDPTQLGRLSRNGVPQDWSGQEAYPGIINPATSYHYKTVSIFVPNWLPFLQISLDSNSANIFGSAYDTSYNSANLSQNWLGDAGASGNFFGTSPRFFQVFAQTAFATPAGGLVVIVLNETVTNAGLNSPVGVLVEAFSDTDFNEAPEPSTCLLFGAGVVSLAAFHRRRRLTHQ